MTDPEQTGKAHDDLLREFRCGECGNRCTVGTDGDTEYGHKRHPERCPQRPESVDPENPGRGGDDG